MSRPTYMHIDLAALKANVKRVRDFAPHRAIMAMVKANAYGHGIVCIAKALQEVDALGVASLEEGLCLRAAGITQAIVLMEGLFAAEELAEAAKHQFTLVVHHEPHIAMLEKAHVTTPFPIWLKINTGMCRLGIPAQDLPRFFERLTRVAAVQQPIGLMTHFADADELDRDMTKQQLALFNSLTHGLPGPRSLANSAGIMGWPDALGDWVRPGLMLYGASPFEHTTGADFGLQPVMTLSSRLIAINHVKAGAEVGYGGTWTAAKDSLVGIVAIGYGDGYPRQAENGTPVLVNGVECELVGRVSMDMLAVDLSNQPQAKINDEVILWGKGLPVERVAHYSHTSPYELLTRMTPRPKIEVSG